MTNNVNMTLEGTARQVAKQLAQQVADRVRRSVECRHVFIPDLRECAIGGKGGPSPDVGPWGDMLIPCGEVVLPNPLAAMCHHQDTHSHEWSEPALSKALVAPVGIAAVRPMGYRMGLGG